MSVYTYAPEKNLKLIQERNIILRKSLWQLKAIGS